MSKDITVNNVPAYHAYPDSEGKHPGLIVIEEIWGLNKNIKSIADRFAKAGFSVVAPEILPREVLAKLTPEFQKEMADPEKRNAAQPKLREAMQPLAQPDYAEGAIATLKACADYLLADEHVNGNVAVLGFCFGGSYAFHLAAHDPRIKAAVPFYGQPPSDEELPNITCPVLAFYGDQDARLMETLPKLKEDMNAADKDFEAVVYEGAGHAFFNDTNEYMYRPDAAKVAWEKTLAFLGEHLG